jgi:serpin B
MNAAHREYELHAADALWAEQDVQFLDSYLNLTKTNYGAGFHPVDFKHSPDAVRNTINQWAEQQTSGKITNLMGPGTVTQATRLVLTNAIYFKGTWQNPFKVDLTDDEDFHLTDRQTVKTPMMNRNGGYRYYDGGSFQELEMPYKGGELAMVVLLPKKIDGLAALEKSFTAAAMSKWIEKLAPVNKVVLTLPRFKVTEQFELSGTLSAMGMEQAFTGAADFSGMTGRPEFSISAAIHKAYIDVNEQGTEAAAATAIAIVGMAMQRPNNEPPPIVFDADHPFLFLIRDQETGAILFLGRVTDPTK